MNYPKVSIVVIARNEEKMLPACLDALARLDYPKEEMEIVVVDDRSTDETREVIKRYPVKCVLGNMRGRGSARNSGIKASSGEFIAFTDADCIVARDWLIKMVKGFDGPETAGCGGAIGSFRVKTIFEKCTDLILCVQKQAIEGEAFFLPFIVTCNAIFRREALDRVGLFDPAVPFGEDIDIGWRLLLQGYRFNYLADAVVWHRDRSNAFSFCDRIFRYGATQSLILRRYSALIKKKRFLMPYLPKLKFNKITAAPFLMFARLFYLAGEIYGQVFLNHPENVDLADMLSPERVIWWKKDGQVGILKLSTGEFYTLEGAGARVYELLKRGNSVEGAARIISDEYDVTVQEAARDILSLVSDLKEV